MSTKQRVIQISTPDELQLTPSEIEVLKQHFKAALANVLSARPQSESIVSETNIQPIIAARSGSQSKKGKKGAKKGSAKKGAAKKGTKKTGARKTSRKK